MNKAIRTTLGLVLSLMLLSGLMMAQAAGTKADKDKNKEHHSRLSKAAFWRHHKDADKNAKQAKASPATSKSAQAKATQVKPVSAKQTVGSKNQKQEQHASNMSKPASKKTSPANKKALQKTDSKAVSAKQ